MTNFLITLWQRTIDLIVNRTLIAHLSLYARLTPTCDRKISIMGLVYIINQWTLRYIRTMPRGTAWQGRTAKVMPCHKYICGHCVRLAAACRSMLHSLKIWLANCLSHQRKSCDIEAVTLFSVVLKTTDRMALTPVPANGVPTKGKHVAYMICHKYESTRAAAAGNNFTFTSVLYCISFRNSLPSLFFN